MFVEPVVFVQHRDARRLDGRHVAEGIPHDFKVVIHFAAASHKEAFGDITAPVATAAGEFQFLEQMNMLAIHLSVADKIKRRRQTGKPRTDDIGGFLIHVFRLFGMGE